MTKYKTNSRAAAADAVGRRRGRPRGEQTRPTRDVLLDAAQRIMLDEGYAAVSTRRVAALAGTDKALVHYYFESMDDLFIALFRRSAEGRAVQLGAALASPQPLWSLWDVLHERSSTALMSEFLAVANHRQAVKKVMVENSRKFRRLQLNGLTTALEGYGLDPGDWPPAAVIVLLSAVARYLRTDEVFGVELGHDETIAIVERQLARLEGPRASEAVATSATRRAPRGKARATASGA